MSRTTLTEIKKGQTGTGLLIENDGYISLSMEENKPLSESLKIGENGVWDLPRPFVLSAVLQKYGIENANKRIYPEQILKREAEKYQKAIDERRAYGENNHPDSTNIDLSRISLNIVEMHWVGHTLMGKIEIPITEGFRKYGIVSCQADHLAHLILSGLRVGVSSRGLGSVKNEFGRLVVDDDYEIVCWDAVSTPSTPGAWIGQNEEELRPYMESKTERKPLLKEDKFTKFEKWLSD